MAEKLSDKLKGLFKRADTSLGKGVDRLKSYPAKIKSLPKKGYDKVKVMQNVLAKSIVGKGAITKKPKLSTSKALTVFDPKKGLPAKASQLKKLGKFGKLKAVARVASRVALPVALGVEGASLAYKVATLSPEKKAKVKKLKSKLNKKTTKQSHADLLKMSTGGDTMLKGGQKKLDKNKDGKISGEDFKMMKPKGAVLGTIALGVGAKKLMGNKKNQTTGPILMPQDKKNQTTGLMPHDKKNQQQPQTTGQQQASKGKMMKARYGTMAKGDVSKALQKEKVKKDEKELTRRELIKKLRGAQVGPVEEAKVSDMSMSEMNKKLAGYNTKKTTKIKNMYKGGESKGYGAARTQGQGLQDENLIPGKSLDYYKDIM